MDKDTQKNYEEMYHSNIEQIIEMVGDCERLSILAGFYAAKLYDSDKEKARERFELLEAIQKNFQNIHDELRKRRKLFDEEEAKKIIDEYDNAEKYNIDVGTLPLEDFDDEEEEEERRRLPNGMLDDDDYHFKDETVRRR